MKLSSVRLSVCPSVPHCGFVAVGPAARRYQSLAAQPALSSKCEHFHVVMARR